MKPMIVDMTEYEAIVAELKAQVIRQLGMVQQRLDAHAEGYDRVATANALDWRDDVLSVEREIAERLDALSHRLTSARLYLYRKREDDAIPPASHDGSVDEAPRLTVVVYINGRTSFYPLADSISYEEVVTLAGMRGQPSVIYHRGPAEAREGELLPGQRVGICDGMIFDVAHTTNA